MKKLALLILCLVLNIAAFAQQDSAKVAPQKDTISKVDDQVVEHAETMPEFPNPRGIADPLNEYLRANINYPQFEMEQGKQGTVYVSFIVEKDGSVTNVVVSIPVAGAPGFGREAVRVVKAMPKWKPATLHGKPVRVSVTLPVKFILKGKVKKSRH
jgi:periplasmic protein TonB